MKHILVVDADLSTRALVEDALGGPSVEVWGAANPAVALETLTFDLVPDAVLVGADGDLAAWQDFATRLENRYGKRIPLVALVRGGEGSEVARAIGADGWLPLPLQVDRLREEAAHWLAAPTPFAIGGSQPRFD